MFGGFLLATRYNSLLPNQNSVIKTFTSFVTAT